MRVKTKPNKCFFTVSKTTKELVLRWKEDNPIDISDEVKMPQFEIFRIVASKCQETMHIGKQILAGNI